MATSIGTSGAFNDLQLVLRDHRAYVPKTIDEMVNFSKTFSGLESQILEKQKQALREKLRMRKAQSDELEANLESKLLSRRGVLLEEKKKLEDRLASPSNSRWILSPLFDQIDRQYDKNRLKHLSTHFEEELHKPFRSDKQKLTQLIKGLDQSTQDIDSVARHRVMNELGPYERTKQVLQNYNPHIAGMIGESRAVTTLSTLPDSFTVLNDVRIVFNPGYRRKSHKDYIVSVQIDHMIIGPPGIFVVETKHWSQKSIESLNLRSPVEQLKRSGYAIYRYTQDNLKSAFSDHWGNLKIPVRNILLMTNVPVDRDYEMMEVHHISTITKSLTKRPEKMSPQAVGKVVALFQKHVKQS